jgi:alkanesulfonate monooxygenase SsuD/methylene tetrahydromethanopterin reductase-like flavin-dependent oxidoreductase (luciferase family)
VGAPEEIAEVIKMYEAIGVDQLIYSPLTMTMDQKYVLRSIETFGKHILPLFDRDPVHSTKRQREAAVKQAA